ncbi:MAG: hypothetical protein RLN70_01315, partial [Rhodospirillaceae bacterium]
MSENRSTIRPLALVAGLLAGVFGAIGAGLAQERPFGLPDLSSYSCANVEAATAAGVRHMGQVINGRYHEWHEIYSDVDGNRRLACISLIVPEARQMSVGEVRAFLRDAANARSRRAPSSGTPANAQRNLISNPENPPPRPLLQLIIPEAGASVKKNGASGVEVPPRPAVKDFRDTGSK